MIYIEKYQLFVDVEVTDFKVMGKDLGYENNNYYHRVNLHLYQFDNKKDELRIISTFQPIKAMSLKEIMDHIECYKQS